MKRGFSVLELTLVGTLLSMVTLLLVQALTPCLRIWVATENVSEVRTLGVLAHQRVFAELRGSTEKSLSVSGSSIGFLVVGQEGGYNPVNGAPIYREMVAYWLSGSELWRRSSLVAGLPTVTPFAFSATELNGFCRGGKRVCTDVTAFSLVANGSRLWKLRLDTQKGMVQCRRESDLYFRN